MCVSPNHIDGVGSVACHTCWQCRANRVNDYVGRCIAESQEADTTLAVTLTYREDSPNSTVLIYSDFQKLLKRLRAKATWLTKKGLPSFSVRYIVAGEYGSKKGRAHWHAILFFKGKGFRPPPLEMRVQWEFWPHGFSYFQKPDYGGFSYVLKYILKDEKDAIRQNHFALSKKPPLGEGFFINGSSRKTCFDELVPTKLALQVLGRARYDGQNAGLSPARRYEGTVSGPLSRRADFLRSSQARNLPAAGLPPFRDN